MIHVEQAVFGSANTRHKRGYQLLAQSPGVNEAIASELIAWAPTRKALLSGEESFESLNTFLVLEDWLVVSRTIYGRPEYSGRGELETTTRFLVAPLASFESYEFNPLWIARTAMTLGHLRMYSSDEPSLEAIRLPKQPLLGVSRTAELSPALGLVVEETAGLLADDRQVALVGVQRPLDVLSTLYSRIAPSRRGATSFTTGLQPSPLRPFRIHFLSPRQMRETGEYVARNLAFVEVDSGRVIL